MPCCACQRARPDACACARLSIADCVPTYRPSVLVLAGALEGVYGSRGRKQGRRSKSERMREMKKESQLTKAWASAMRRRGEEREQTQERKKEQEQDQEQEQVQEQEQERQLWLERERERERGQDREQNRVRERERESESESE
eukprot:3973048-Pleurochrysis_carterae.AAC.6